ncbi:erythrocyte band 7 integral membrane protein-like isoform X2 [Stegodyphus dumicola]|uniref:erythrocyte band 7 integral membrane protein-like isoform X2 n=1 Tax=Stegodyphus dumicola TaxID=202533 RepID=UPI0015B1CDFD|nr:erythrocyte band 7 integral membrane protein-like isoform X2 [Stegodyphus dumicola]
MRKTEPLLYEVARETWPSMLLRYIITFVLHVLVIIMFPVTMWICLKRVHALERIVLMRLGKLQPIRGPGFAFILPCIDQWTRVDLRPQIFTFSTPQLLTADGGIIEAKTDIEYRVSDVISYVLKLHKQESTLKDLGLFCLKNIISEKDQEDLESSRELVNCNIKDELNRSVINWGLEVINVYLHSVKILKTADPVDAIGTIMTALKAATGQSTQHAAAVFPFGPNVTDNKMNAENEMKAVPSGSVSQHQDHVATIKKLADIALNKGLLKDLKATFRLDIVGQTTSTVFCKFENGAVSVFEDKKLLDCDVTLMLTEDNLQDFLNGEISPLQAFMDGKVMVTGDWSLLRSLAKLFD